MTSENSEPTLPIITIRSRWLDLRIDTGELLFPAIVLLFCAAYFYETRGLPKESMLYAGPLLYATALLAVITILGHAVSVHTQSDTINDSLRTDRLLSVVWGVEQSTVEQEHTNEKSTREDTIANTTIVTPLVREESSHFDMRSAIGLVVLSTGYISALYVVPFVLATVAFLAVTVYLFGERSVLRIVGYSVGITLILWIVFINWLFVPLP